MSLQRPRRIGFKGVDLDAIRRDTDATTDEICDFKNSVGCDELLRVLRQLRDSECEPHCWDVDIPFDEFMRELESELQHL